MTMDILERIHILNYQNVFLPHPRAAKPPRPPFPPDKKGQSIKVRQTPCVPLPVLGLYKPRLHFHRFSHPPILTSINMMVKPLTLLVILALSCFLVHADGEILTQNRTFLLLLL